MSLRGCSAPCTCLLPLTRATEHKCIYAVNRRRRLSVEVWSGRWLRRRTPSTASWTSTSPGRSATSPSASGRSTSTGSTRTSGSSCPQLVEALLERHLPRARHVLDPFAGSGTTLVQSLESGRDATGVDVAAFNCLLMRVKTARVQPLHARARAARLASAARAFRRRATASPECLPRRVVRAAGGGRAPVLPLPHRRLRAWRRPANRARARGPLGAADDALRPRLPTRAAAWRVLVPQAPQAVPPGRTGRALPAPLRARHARADP